jgi:branched-chain amino acid transport system permease protein
MISQLTFDRNYIGVAIFAGVIALLGTYPNTFYQSLIITLLLSLNMSMSWNLLAGYAGQFSLGHAVFFGIGAYTSTILYVNFGITPWIGIVLGGIAASLIGSLISYPCFRLRGPFFTLATLAIAEIMRVIAVTWKDLTMGSVGISIPFSASFKNMIFMERQSYVYLILAISIFIFLVTIKVSKSRLGYQLMAMRQNEEAAQMMGINTPIIKLLALLISSFTMGIIGVFYAQYILYIEPDDLFSMNMSLQPALISIIGGIGTVWGPLVGAVILTFLSEFLRAQLGGSAYGLHLIIYAILLLLVVLLIPQGVLEWLKKCVKIFSTKKLKAREV